MDFIVDANVIFAALIKKGKSHELLFDERLHLFTTEFFFTEFKKHSEEIKRKSGKSHVDFSHLMSVIKSRLTLIPLEDLLPYLDEAEAICPDPADVAYFALALKLRCGLWSNDKALKKQDSVKVYSTEELLRLL